MAQRILGLDIGSWSIKAVVVESSLRKVSVTRFRERHLPVDASGNSLAGELPAALRTLMQGLEADLVVTAIPGVQVLSREVELPFADAKRIAPVLGFQLESQLPRPLDTVVYDWHMVRKNEDGTSVLMCPAADRAWLDAWLGELRAGNADPRTVTLSSLAMENLSPHMAGQAGTRIILDLGHRSTQLTLLKKGRFETFRALSRGGHHATLGLARTLGLAYADAEHIKHVGVRLDGEPADGVDEREHVRRARAVMQALEPLLRDIKLTIDGFRARVGEIGDVVLIGGGARLLGIDQVLERMLEVPVVHAELTGPMWEGLAAGGERGTAMVATAIALEHVADAAPHRVNLRRGDLAYASDLGALRARATWTIAFLVAITAVYFVRKAMRIGTLEDHQAALVERLEKHASTVLKETLGGDSSDPAGQFTSMSKLVTTPLENETDQVYPSMTAFSAFYEVTRIMKTLNDRAMPDIDDDPENPEPKKPAPSPTELKQVELGTFVADTKSITLSGSGFDIVTIEDFVSSLKYADYNPKLKNVDKLKEHKCFKKVERLEAKKSASAARPGWTDFTIKIEVKCDRVGEPQPRVEADSGKPAGDAARGAGKGDKLPGAGVDRADKGNSTGSPELPADGPADAPATTKPTPATEPATPKGD